MTVTERQRHDLFVAVEGVLDATHAETLMNLLPPVGWADVATKQDLDHQRELLELRIDALDAKFEGKLEAIEAKLEAVDARFVAIDARFVAVDARFDAVDARLATMVTAERFEAAMRKQTVGLLVALSVLLGVYTGIAQLAG